MLALVVDDDACIRTFIRTVLELQRFRTLEAGGGNEGLRIVEELDGALDLLVTDLQMPDGDGLSFARAVHRKFPSVPIILASGQAKPDAPFEFLEKPFASATLVGVVRRLLAELTSR